ncbi:trypsin-like serine protease [Archangium lansingense]|uniref:Trypsin-like serine protease n=1 Tax=Archangium lansingense TaxID=2995310 RepID=A0ABT4ANK7_9BACT|nr:trypsin-like serine protease [Archangium lansinium]MCY1083266.1 trypsin-like serine protease [Archangium lansinium]
MNKLLLASALLLALVSPGCGGCVARTEDGPGTVGHGEKGPAVHPAAESSAAAGMEGTDASASALRWSRVIGEVDSTNRYPSTVTVTGHLAENPPERRECSGVLVSPRLVLTAGHCVCARKEAPPGGNGRVFQIEPSTCAATATVATFTYGSPSRGKGRR